jgi:hypothetical protein
MRFSLLLLLNCWLTVPLLSQQGEPGNWFMYFGQNKIHDKISLHSEIQYRNFDVLPPDLEQLLVRVGVNYHATEKAMLTAGYGYIANHEFESPQVGPEIQENRIWQQFILKNNLSRIQFEHRYRIEQRWIEEVFKSRFRYRVMVSIPLNKPMIEKGCLYIAFYDEIFVNGNADFFDRNRLYGALGYQISKGLGVQIGLLNQQLPESNKQYFQLALMNNIRFVGTR